MGGVGNDNIVKDKIGDPRSVAPAFHQLGEWEMVEEMSIMGATHPVSEDVGEVALLVGNALQDKREVALAIGECQRSLDRAKDRDVSAIHSPWAVREAHAAEAQEPHPADVSQGRYSSWPGHPG